MMNQPSLKILVVDDEDGILMYFRDIFESLGHTVVSALDGVKAQQALQQSSFDIVISDLVMPNMDGAELLSWMRKQNIQSYFVIMSAYYNNTFLSFFKSQGVNKVISKPVSIDTLEEIVTLHLSDKQLSAQDQTPIVNLQSEITKQTLNEAQQKLLNECLKEIQGSKWIVLLNNRTGKSLGYVSQASDTVDESFIEEIINGGKGLLSGITGNGDVFQTIVSTSSDYIFSQHSTDNSCVLCLALNKSTGNLGLSRLVLNRFAPLINV